MRIETRGDGSGRLGRKDGGGGGGREGEEEGEREAGCVSVDWNVSVRKGGCDKWRVGQGV